MYKILLSSFLFLILLFPLSEAFAQEACTVQFVCENPAWTINNNKCGPRAGRQPGNPPAPLPIINSASCPAGTGPNSTATDGTCECVANDSGETVSVPAAPATTGTAPAAGGTTNTTTPTATPCTGPDCTKGGGQRCIPGTTTMTITPDGPGIMTAIGCIPTEPKALVEGLLKFGTLAAGGIAFLLMILGALGMITAEGNPESIKHAQEMFYSAIIGLLLIIFSVLLMQVIGVDVLGLPGFGNK